MTAFKGEYIYSAHTATFWCVKTAAVFRSSFLVLGSVCLGVSGLFSGVFSMSRCDRLVFWYVLNVAVWPSCLLLCPDIGVSRLVFCCVRNVAMCSPCSLVCPDVRLFAFFACVRNVVVRRPCFRVYSECLGVSALFSGVSIMLPCVSLVF